MSPSSSIWAKASISPTFKPGYILQDILDATIDSLSYRLFEPPYLIPQLNGLRPNW